MFWIERKTPNGWKTCARALNEYQAQEVITFLKEEEPFETFRINDGTLKKED